MFNQRKPKRFNYKSRLPDSVDDKSRKDLKSKWAEIRGNTKRKGSFLTSLPALIILLVFIFVLMHILNGYLK